VPLSEVARTELLADSEPRTQIDEVCEKARDPSHAMDAVVWAVNSRRDTLRILLACMHAQLFGADADPLPAGRSRTAGGGV
jgi:hypothetical protein